MSNLRKNFEAVAKAKEELEIELSFAIQSVLEKFEKKYSMMPCDITIPLLDARTYGRANKDYIVGQVDVRFDHEYP